MAFIKHQPQGSIVQAIIAIRDTQYHTAETMTSTLAEYEVTWKTLQENRKFVEGVWSGFTWPLGQEALFWRLLISYKEIAVVSVTEIAENLVPA